MTPFVSFTIYTVGVFTAIMQLLLVIFIVATFASANLREWIHERLGRHGVLVALTLVGGSILGSLFFSEIARLPACFLCLVERALMYPQIIFFGWYLYKPHRSILYSTLFLSIAGFIVSAYQIALENGAVKDILSCETLGSGVSCSVKYFELFGYLTIPVMSISVFAVLITLCVVVLHRKHWLPKKAKEYAQLP